LTIINNKKLSRENEIIIEKIMQSDPETFTTNYVLEQFNKLKDDEFNLTIK